MTAISAICTLRGLIMAAIGQAAVVAGAATALSAQPTEADAAVAGSVFCVPQPASP